MILRSVGIWLVEKWLLSSWVLMNLQLRGLSDVGISPTVVWFESREDSSGS